MNPSIVDTDILSEFFRGNKSVVQKVEAYLEIYSSINLSIVTYYEILNGLLYKDAKKQLKNFVDFASLNNVIPLTLEAAGQAAKIYANLRKKGNPTRTYRFAYCRNSHSKRSAAYYEQYRSFQQDRGFYSRKLEDKLMTI